MDDLLGRVQVARDQEQVAEQPVDRGRVELLEALAGRHGSLRLRHRIDIHAGRPGSVPAAGQGVPITLAVLSEPSVTFHLVRTRS
jgi:hypothetical protein